ncbi:hypothetical protein PLICRDRAFT_512049 [Plicaturopsis crispa FD-325 SS-3]|nr:hypothetical protein PLICRDRAFT_512049 [Plicaturopsis crispa FD-325 SS-3]
MAARDALWAGGRDEAVEVNQRALIDKVLARYSGEFTVFRELLQNSDDAQSKAVEIHFQTKAFAERGGDVERSEQNVTENELPDLKTALVHQWTFKNNGNIFGDGDWNRLKKIAEGNPDEEKIGAFGVGVCYRTFLLYFTDRPVGFYSLFSVTDDPFVTSGDKWMGFYWKDKKDQLFVKRGDIPSAAPSPWTTFEMVLRTPDTIPSAFDFTRFLASSLTFMEHLSSVSVFFDDKRLARLTKDSGAPRALSIPRGMRCKSTSGMMNVKAIQSTPLHIKAEVMRWVYSAGTQKPPPKPPVQTKPAPSSGFFGLTSFFSGFAATPQRAATPVPPPTPEPVNQLEVTETNVSLSIFSADVDVALARGLAVELERSTKKRPPQKLRYKLIYTAKDEYDASVQEDEKLTFATGSVFQGLRADLEGTGSARIFIGHATAQTTGLGGHMAARFIPTVERENIDLVDRTVAVWNRELLYVGGFLARSAYELELANIRTLWEGAESASASPDPTLRAWLHGRSLHAIRFFAFHQSTPSSDVSNLLEAAFFSCTPPETFPIISSAGIKSISDVRMPDPTFAAFLRNLPVLTDDVITGAPSTIAALERRNMIKYIGFQDVIKELRARPLTETELVPCLKWWTAMWMAQANQNGDIQHLLPIRTQFLDAAVLTTGTPGGPDEKIVPLSSVRTYINPRDAKLFKDRPVPDHVIPLTVTKAFSSTLGVISTSLPWRELTIADWVQHVTDPGVAAANPKYDISQSSAWAEELLVSVARACSTPSKMRDQVVDILRTKPCVPTSSGMKLPGEAYFENANIFHDLPVVKLTVKEKSIATFLNDLGVRKHVDLEVVFSRMVKTGDWTIADLIKYLVAVQASLTPLEIQKLKETKAFGKEGDSRVPEGQKPPRYRPCDLYEPLDEFRHLGLPIIDWGTISKWRSSSDEARFLFGLGLRRYPPLQDILTLAASNDANIRPLALKYFFDNFTSRYANYSPKDFASIAFVPATQNNVTRMTTTAEVFAKPEWAQLGFPVVQQSIREDALTKLKIREDPPTSQLVAYLERSPPKDKVEATKVFGIMAARISDFSSTELKSLSQMPIVPTTLQGAGKTASTQRLSPSQCYFDGQSRAQFHSKLFVFVDFGSQANSFLSACGTKHEPSVEEIANILLANPRDFYEKADGRDHFLIELRNLAVNRRLISSTTLARMKRSPVLLASQRKLKKATTKGRKSDDDLEEEDWELQYDLRKPDEIVIADDSNAYQFFGDSIFTAPQEDLLEGFYFELGSRRLTSLVREDYEKSGEVKNSNIASDTRSLILERLPLFLHEHTHTRTRVSYSWLNDPKNFIVKTFGKLVVTKSLNYGNVKPRSELASAAARQVPRGPIELWLAGNAQVDIVSTSLCRLLFDSPKVNDALLFMTILSTDIRALKRRGYNVDRILRQQKAQRQAAEEAQQKAQTKENTALISAPPPAVPPKGALAQAPNSAPTSSPSENRVSAENGGESKPLMQTHGDQNLARPRPASKIQNTLQNWRQKLAHPGTNGAPHGLPPMGVNGAGPSQAPNQPAYKGITPQSDISRNIDMAIKACTAENRDLLQNRERMQMVKEALNEGYCDINHGIDLSLAGQMGDMKVFIARSVREPASVMATKRDIIGRFINVIRPLASLYKLPPTSLHIFYDEDGPMVAFNRAASLFLNLRFYESWHDNDVRNGDSTQALISWYFTLAHEIAHNLVQPHNSEHEFYMSAICQEYIVPFGRLLSSP